MKRTILVFGFIMVLATALLFGAQNDATEKPVMVITTFDAKGISADDVEFVMNSFTTAFTSLGVARVVDRGSFDKIRGELSFQTSDWSDSKKVAELGRALNATQVVIGQLMKRGANFFLTVRILDVNTTTIISSHLDKVGEIDDFFENMPEFCEQLVAKTKGSVFSDTANSDRKITSRAKVGDYKVGGVGQGGGIVFYVSKAGFIVYDGKGGEETCHYLEMSLNTLGESRWYPEQHYINTQEDLGYGKSNTYKILHNDISETLTEKNCAAYRCSKYSTKNTKRGEWFLPSKEELGLMYRTQRARVLSICTDSCCWSSSAKDKEASWLQIFNTGSYCAWNNGYSLSVFAVRAF